MAKLIINEQIILNNMKIKKNIFSVAKGLMFSPKQEVKNGVLLKLTGDFNRKKGATVHTIFCFYSIDILFVNKNGKVVDKTTLKPWTLKYTPREKCRFIIESYKNTFNSIPINSKINI